MQEKTSEKYIVTGMSCAACSARVEKAVGALEGVESCSVNLLTGDLAVTGSVTADEVTGAVTAAGYGCISRTEYEKSRKIPDGAFVQTDIHRETERNLRKAFVLSLVFLIPLVWLTMGGVMGIFPAPSFLSRSPLCTGVAEMILSTAVLLINRRFFIRGIRGILHSAPNMETLVSLGSGISWLWSTVLLIRMLHLYSAASPGTPDLSEVQKLLSSMYYESAAMIPTLISFGKMLEERAKGKTTDAVLSLKKLQPETAVLLTEEGEKTVSAAAIRPGDRFILRPGASVPADGIILEGTSVLDESMLTGESLPAEKRPAEDGTESGRSCRVFAATVNKTGRLVCRAESTGEDTLLSRIIQMVSNAAASKAPAARIADRVAGIFVPVVLGISLITFTVWMFITGCDVRKALNYAISVMVISCPCALGLATPVAIMVGNGVGAKNGILFKTSEALELTGKARFAVFDKTGTLTEGNFRVTDICPAEGIKESELTAIACSLEQASEHPLAKALTSYASAAGIPTEAVSGFRATGSTVSGTVCGKETVAGSRRSLLDAGIDENSLYLSDETADSFAERGKTPVYFAADGRFLGIIAFEDQMKGHSQDAVRELYDMGITSVLLTGDHELTGKAVAGKLGIKQVHAGVLPSEKAEIIGKLRKEGFVLMIGDGINDAPALKTADIGIAVAGGTDIAVDAGDVVLMKSDPLDVPAAVRLSRLTMRNIRQNLFWAFFYNALCIPLAAGAFAGSGISMTPMTGALCMSFSSLFVVTNALRLNRADIRRKKNMKIDREKEEMKETIEIRGMMCPHCEARVKAAILAVPGVTDAEVSHVKSNAVVTGVFDREAVVRAVRDAGYEA